MYITLYIIYLLFTPISTFLFYQNIHVKFKQEPLRPYGGVTNKHILSKIILNNSIAGICYYKSYNLRAPPLPPPPMCKG